MSKKIMKRSLALGALMAFVITGSAMAGTIAFYEESLNNGNTYTSDNPYETTTLTGSSDEILLFQGDTKEDYGNFYGKNRNSNGIKGYGSLTNLDNLEINALINGIVGTGNGKEQKFLIQAKNISINGIVSSAAINANSSAWVEVSEFDSLIIKANETGKAYSDDGDETEGVGIQTAGDNAKVIINGNEGSIIDIESSQASVYARGESTIEINAGKVILKSNGLDEDEGEIGDDYRGHAVVSRNGGIVDINADEKIEITSQDENANNVKDQFDNYAIYTFNTSNNNSTQGEVNLNDTGKADLIINGNIKANVGTVNANFATADSVFNGNASGNGTINLTFSNGATWNLTGASDVTSLDGDSGKIVFDSELLKEDTNPEELLKIGTNTSENLYVTSNTDLEQEDNPTETATKQLKMMRAAFGEQANDATFAFEETDVLGAFVLGEDGETVTELVNTQNQAIGEAAVGLKLHNRAHFNDMNKRMGELRNSNGEHGVWVRMIRGEQEYEGTKAQYNQYQLGYDEKLSVDKRWTVGAAVTFAEGDSNFKNGSTEDDSTAFAIYGSKLNNDGTFVDLIARYARLESDVTVNAVQGDYSTNGYSVSAEFGKRFTKENGTWIEPQFELTYGSVDSAEYVLGGKTVQVGEMDSLIARAGFAIGKNIKQGNVYARASYLYDFDGETDTAFTSAAGTTRVIPEDLGGGWWEVGVGANINLSKSTYIYADIEKTFGGEVDTNWQWNLGVRYSF